MLNFRAELSKITENRDNTSTFIMNKCLKALLSEFERMENPEPRIFYFYSFTYPNIMVDDWDSRLPILKIGLQNREEVEMYLTSLREYFKSQGYEVEEYYGVPNFRVKITP